MCSIFRRQLVSLAIWTFSKWNICLATLHSWVHAYVCVHACVHAHFMWCFHSKNRTLPTAYKHISHHGRMWTLHKLEGTLKRQSGDWDTGWSNQGSIPEFNPKPVHMGFIVVEMTLGQGFSLSAFLFSCQWYPPLHHALWFMSLMLYNLNHQLTVILAIFFLK